MQQLNLPAYDYKLKRAAGTSLIFDAIRRKYVTLTPEEWVRQHFIHYLMAYLHYPKSLLAIERGTTYNQLAKRTDLCVYGTNGRPVMLVECKAAQIPISAATVKQASVYNQQVKARYVVITNGLEHYCWEVDFATRQYSPLSQIPLFTTLENNS
ncbi:MAG: type I restriction enzyme HsdR N-terminal domain-containing protein [Adhaeribacter sp.]